MEAGYEILQVWACKIDGEPKVRRWVNTEIELGCGTRLHDDIIDLSLSFEPGDGAWSGTHASDAEIDLAIDVIKDLVSDPELGHKGRRNDDAVNLGCALRALGFDIVWWVEGLDKVVAFEADDYVQLMEAVRRVKDYVETWGPTGHEGRALDFMIG